ncbi:hypothetical protein CL615_03030 [archaeon]|jgi:DNA-binding transcriptional regulator/RsmH inhibitor MraZ|nr:hypothetical protein [archaeon]MDP6548301.1 hypothetical protein [Candidatus Woesearchaeota archaeon]|tara:strand:- start:7940 stop:8404 length:465 start_codon:yes stop_codon:yes gene_type:complete
MDESIEDKLITEFTGRYERNIDGNRIYLPPDYIQSLSNRQGKPNKPQIALLYTIKYETKAGEDKLEIPYFEFVDSINQDNSADYYRIKISNEGRIGIPTRFSEITGIDKESKVVLEGKIDNFRMYTESTFKEKYGPLVKTTLICKSQKKLQSKD